MEYVCVLAHGDHEPGNVVEVPDGAEVSALHFALPGSPEAAAAQAGRGAVTHFEHPAEPAPSQASAESPEIPPAPGVAPHGFTEGSNL